MRHPSSHRNRPQGLDGGGDGEAGSTKVRRSDGAVETRDRACDQTVLEAGEAVIVTTPTAGGFGSE